MSKVFISYAREDRAAAEYLAGGLRAARIPVWLDLSEVQPGESFVDRVSEGLGQATFVILLWSNASKMSPWVAREWKSSISRGVVLLPVMLEHVEVPAIISDLAFIDMTASREHALRELLKYLMQAVKPHAEQTTNDVGADFAAAVSDFPGLLYKGAGPGTHWAVNDLGLLGFVAPANRRPDSLAAIAHISKFSHPSPFTSLCVSYAVAKGYALAGGVASQTNPGYVYEIDPRRAGTVLYEPIRLVVSGTKWPQWSPSVDGSTATSAAKHSYGATTTPTLQAVGWAIRDGEVFAQRIAQACVTKRVPVW